MSHRHQPQGEAAKDMSQSSLATLQGQGMERSWANSRESEISISKGNAPHIPIQTEWAKTATYNQTVMKLLFFVTIHENGRLFMVRLACEQGVS